MGISPNWPYKYVPTQAQWDQAFAAKQDDLGLDPTSRNLLQHGLGDMAIQNANAVAITGGTITGIAGLGTVIPTRADIAALTITATTFWTYDGAQWIHGSVLGPMAIQDATAQWWEIDLSGGMVNAVWFGADREGAIDSLASIQAAIDLSALNGYAYLPGGIYSISGTLIFHGNAALKTAGWNSVVLRTTSATADMISLPYQGTPQPYDIEISGIQFRSAVTRTAGAAIHISTGKSAKIDNIYTYGMFNNFYADGGVSIVVDNVKMQNTVAGGTGFYLTGGANDWFISNVAMDTTDTANQPLAAIYADDFAAAQLNNCDFIHAGYGMLIQPGNGQTVKQFFFEQVAFDTCLNDGIYINPTGTGKVYTLFFTNCWTSSNNNGIHHGSSGTIDSVFYTNHRSNNNQRHGTLLDGGVNAHFTACQMTGNSELSLHTYDAFHVSAGVSSFYINGGLYAQSMQFTNTQGYGVNIETGASDSFIIEGAILSPNYSGNMFDGSTGRNKVIHGNLPLDANFNVWMLLKHSAVAVSTTSVSKTQLASAVVPKMGPDSKIKITLQSSFTNSTKIKQLYLDFGGVNFLTTNWSTSGNVTDRLEFTIANRGATNSQIADRPATTGFGGTGNAAFATGAVDTSTAQTLVISGSTDGTETFTLESYTVEICHTS